MGGPLIILINGVSYLISAFTELFITVPKTVHQGEKITLRGIFSDFGVAIRETLRNRYLRLFVSSALILNIEVATASSLMLPFTLEKDFTVEMYGYLMSAETAASLMLALPEGNRGGASGLYQRRFHRRMCAVCRNFRRSGRRFPAVSGVYCGLSADHSPDGLHEPAQKRTGICTDPLTPLPRCLLAAGLFATSPALYATSGSFACKVAGCTTHPAERMMK